MVEIVKTLPSNYYTVIFASIFLFSFGIVVHNAFASGSQPGSCSNEYDGPITNATITVGSQTYYPLNNSVSFQLANDKSYTLSFTIHTPSQDLQGNSLPGTVWYRTNYQGFGNGVCQSGAGPNQDYIVSGNFGHSDSNAPTGSYTDQWSTTVTGFSYTINWVNASPQNLQATAGNSQINLTWSAPSNSGIYPPTNYKIYRSTSSGTETLLTTLGSVNSYTDTSVTNGQIYYYYVTAGNPYGDSLASNEVSATPSNGSSSNTVPSAPQNLQAAAGNAQVTLSWTAPSNGGSPITNYKIYRSSSSGTEGYLITVGNVTSYTDTGLARGHTYFYKITAVNGIGASHQSNEASATTFNIPSAPQNLQATGGSAQVSLSWQAPSSNGGSAITNYKIYRSSSSGTEGYLITVGNVTSYTNTGLANGHTYFYKITAVNGIGTSPVSNEASATPSASSAPSAPTGANATLSTPSTIKLSWNPPVSSGSSQVTGYKIERSTDNGSTWGTIVSNSGSVSTTYSDTVRSPGTSYTYRISAINSAGNSLPSSPASVTTPAISITAAFETCCWGAMQINGYTQPMPGFDEMRLLLLAPNGTLVINSTESAGGFGIYHLISRSDGKGNYNITLTYDKLVSTHLLPSWINNDPTIYLAASESWSSSGDVHILAQVFNDITGEYVSVAIKNSTNATIASYSQSTSPHGMAEFYIDPAAAKQIFTKSGNYTIVATHVPTGVKTQTVLTYTTPATVPQPPTGLAASTVSSSQINLGWSAPTNNGGSAITGYEIERSNDTGSTWNIIVSNTGNTVTTFSDTGLAPSTSYTYRVSAINSAGTSSPSNTVSATTSPSSTPSTAIITVKAVDSSGTVLHMYTLLKTSAGVTLTTGFTPVGFTVNTNTDYLVKVSNYSTHIFQHWQDQPSNTNQVRPINISQNTTIVAVFS